MEIKQTLSADLTRMGFAVKLNSIDCRLLVVGTAEIIPANIAKSQWQFVRCNADFQMIDLAEDKIIGSISRSGKEGHRTVAEADKKALRSLQADIVSHVSRELSRYVFGR